MTGLLRRLDERLLPPLGRGLARAGRTPGRLRFLTGAAVAASVAVLLTAVWAADRPAPSGDDTVGDVVRLGVVEGDSIPGYADASAAELATLGGATTAVFALVTFTEYLAPDRLAAALEGRAAAVVVGRVPLAGAQTEIVRIAVQRLPADLIGGMGVIAERKDREAEDYRRLSAKLTGDSAQELRLRTVYDSGAAVAATEATAYRDGCSCLYAAVIRATPAELTAVAERPEVRVVDPAPELSRLDRAVLLPPLPEQDDVVKPPVDGLTESMAPLGTPVTPGGR
ncbi:hypothetical protein J2S43_000497 [Catenuloplanes nepalensis]|uniref:Uncharacterized protein n=1 Tax=Catenuloplanes nepalensis TaxID=587533 RepID=A0ABT9MKP1_9ACTN|nr:hypothetical protein [Catenuloplanes nepalensis]MDP9791985.1 hypothetical protein [Catenuloplanes nepalensis]